MKVCTTWDGHSTVIPGVQSMKGGARTQPSAVGFGTAIASFQEFGRACVAFAVPLRGLAGVKLGLAERRVPASNADHVGASSIANIVVPAALTSHGIWYPN